MIDKKTKIVATIGPATESKEMLTKAIEAGVNMVRLNFSHGSFEEHLPKLKIAREISKKTGRAIAVMQDLCGPKIRIGEFENGPIELKEGKFFTLTTRDIIGNEEEVSINYKGLPKSVKKGGIIMLHDGNKKLQVVSVDKTEVKCKVLAGGKLGGKKGVNLPGADLDISSLTEKDKADLEFGLKHDVDYVALSFVRKAKDVLELKDIIKKRGGDIKVVVKVETTQAIENLDEIIAASDAIMIARGDLGVEIPVEDVPVIQKEMIEKCRRLGKPVITATHVLESMIKNPRPTRAEASDIANAVWDGTDAIMLSEETTLGEFPIQAIETMATVARNAEDYPHYNEAFDAIDFEDETPIVDAVSACVCHTADLVGAKLIVAFTMSGYTARIISRWRPEQQILGLTPNKKTFNQLALVYGVVPTITAKIKTEEQMVEMAKKAAIQSGLVKKGDRIVISAGVPFKKSGTTNLMLVQEI